MTQNMPMPGLHRSHSPIERPARARGTCPVCYSVDRVDKVSNVVRTGRGKLIWEDGEVAHYETELSELLDEPRQPKAVPIHKALLGLVPPLLVLAATLGVLSLLSAQEYTTIPENALKASRNIALVWFGVLIPGVLLVRYLQGRSELEREVPRWMLARRRWTGLYYCSRDDVVYAENSDIVVSPAEVSDLLYDPPPVLVQPQKQEVAIPRGGLRAAK